MNQSGDTAPPPPHVCEYSVAPIQFSPCMSAAFNLTATITTQPGCTWTASSGAPWITMTGGESGSGPGVVSFTVSDNWEAPRMASSWCDGQLPPPGRICRCRRLAAITR